jgi:hypothetical protein
MKKTALQLLFILGFTAIVFAQDTILMKNGDVLTGTVLQQNAESVYFKSSAFGSVSLQSRDIQEIRIQTPAMGEVTVPTAAIAEPTEEPPAAPKTKPAKYNPVIDTETENVDRWSGQAGLAIAMRESNTLRRRGDELVEKDETFESYRVYGNVNWKGEANTLRWNWTYRYSRTDVRKNDDFLNLTQNYQHNFSKKYFAAAKTLYQRDFRRGIEDEYLQTAELGVKWMDQPELKFTTSAGGGYHKYDRLENVYSDANTKFVLDESLRWQLVNSLTLFQKYTHLGNLEKYHFVFNTGLENKLIRDVFLRLEYRLDRDTEVNYDDKSYYDKALLTSVLYKF